MKGIDFVVLLPDGKLDFLPNSRLHLINRVNGLHGTKRLAATESLGHTGA